MLQVVLFIVGALAVAAGVGLAWLPGGLMVAGCFCVVAAVALERSAASEVGGDGS